MNRIAEKRFVEVPVDSARKGIWSRIAHGISEVTNPAFVALPTFLCIALYTAPDIPHALLWWGVTVAGITMAPLLFIWQGVRRGRYSDHHVSRREQRFVPLLFAVTCFFLTFVLLLLLHASTHLVATVTAALAACAIATIVTRAWKISIHLVGMAGAVTVFCLLFGFSFLLLSPLVLLVAWARWQVRAHTPLQALAGTILAVGVTLITFWLFGAL